VIGALIISVLLFANTLATQAAEVHSVAGSSREGAHLSGDGRHEGRKMAPRVGFEPTTK
jgi:hypothetical protein